MQLISKPGQRHAIIAAGMLMWFIAAMFYGLDYLQHAIPSVLIEPVAGSIGVSYVDIANIMSVFFPVYAISQIPAGRLIDRYGLKVTMASGCLLMSVGLMLMVMPEIFAIFSGRVLTAVGSAFAFIGTLKTVSIWFPRHYFAFFVGLTQTIGVIGGLLGQVLINYLVTRSGWQHATLSIVIFGGFWSMVILFLLKNSAPLAHRPVAAVVGAKKSRSGSFLSIIQDRNLWIITLYAAIMVGAVMNTFAETYDVLFLQKAPGITSQQAAEVTMFIFIGVGVGAPLHGIIAGFFNNQRTWLIICAIATFLIFLFIPLAFLWSFNLVALVIIYFFLGFFVSSMLLSFSIAKCCYPIESHGLVFAFVNTVMGLAGFFFPVLFGEGVKIINHYLPFNNELLLPTFLLSLSLLISVVLSFFVQCAEKRSVPSASV